MLQRPVLLSFVANVWVFQAQSFLENITKVTKPTLKYLYCK